MSIIELRGTKTEPDIIHEYPKSISENSTPVVIDNGNECRRKYLCYYL